MKKLAIMVAGLAVAACSPRTEPEATRVDALFSEWNGGGSPGCAVGVSRDGMVIHERGYGMADVESGIPISPTSVFSAASVSKQFTAMSILLLAERGQLSLDDPIQKHIPEWVDTESRVTVRHLLNHTSGLREGFGLLGWAVINNTNSNVNDAMVPMLARQRGVNFAPGERYEYNNGGYNLLGSIVKRASGEPLRVFADTNIFKPLGMTRSGFRDDVAMRVPNLSVGYTKDAAGLLRASEQFGVVGNAGLFTTVGDLLLWEKNFNDARVGTPELLTAMQTRTTLVDGRQSAYGFGLAMGEYRGIRTVEHAGGDQGVVSNFVRFPEHRLAIAMLCNLDTIDVHALTQRIADIYLSDVLGPAAPAVAASSPPPATLTDDELEELAKRGGAYRNLANDQSVSIAVQDRKVIMHDFYGADNDIELTPIDVNRLALPGGILEFAPATAVRPQEWHIKGTDGQELGVLQASSFAPALAELEGYAGEYRSPELDVTYRVVRGESGLVILSALPDVQLFPLTKDVFTGSPVGTVKFLRGTTGAITGFTLNRYTVFGVRFDRAN